MKPTCLKNTILPLVVLSLVISCRSQTLDWSFDARPVSKDWNIVDCTAVQTEKVDGFSGSGIRIGTNGFYKTVLDRAAEGSEITLSAFVFPTAYPPEKLGNNILSASSSREPKKMLYALRMQNNRLELVVFNRFANGSLHYRSVVSSIPVPLNRWTHVCGVRDSQGLHLYINGMAAGARKLAGTLEPADTFHIGTEVDPQRRDRRFSGMLDGVSVRYAALDARQVARAFAAVTATPSPVEVDGDLFYPLRLPAPSPEFPHAPVRVDIGLQFLQDCLDRERDLAADHLDVVAWNRRKNRPIGTEVECRVSSDLHTRRASVGFRRIGGVSDYALRFSAKQKPFGSQKIPLIGAGEPLSVGRTDIGADLGQGLAGYPAVVDFDGDGDKDLLVAFVIPRRVFFYENIGTDPNGDPILNAPKMIWGGKSLLNFDISQSPDGTISALSAKRTKKNVWEKGEHPAILLDRWIQKDGKLEWAESVPVPGLPAGCEIFDLVFQDADGDGVKDLLLGVQEGTWWWPDGIDPWNKGNGSPKIGYGKGYDSQNRWLGNAPTGSVWLALNSGTTENPSFEKAQILEAGGQSIKMPTTQISPCLVDLDKDGRLDLLLATGVDKMLAFRNRSKNFQSPELERPVNALRDSSVSKWSYFDSRFEVCDWDNDGEDEILVCSNPGVVVKCEIIDGKLVEEKILQCRGGNLWADSLVVPDVVDFNRDGTWDVVMGDASGYLNFFPNTGSNTEPLFKKRVRLKSGCAVFHPVAGYSGSIQGPEEARWGYLAPTVCDWDGDGKYDIVASDITGYLYWLPNFAEKPGGCALGKPVPLEVDGWPLKTRWRTKPAIFREPDGSPFVVTSDPEGFLAMYKRDWIQGSSALKPAERLKFRDGREIKIDSISGYNGRNKLLAADWNGDGKTDLLIGQTRRSGVSQEKRFDLPRSGNATVVLMLNTGSNTHPVFAKPEPLLLADGSELAFGTHSCSPSVFDYDGDGRDDLFVGAETGFVHCFNRSMFEDASQIIAIPSCAK